MTDLPQGWREVALKDLAEGGNFFDGDWVESKDQDPNGTVRLVQLSDVGEGNFRHKSDRWLREDQAEGLGVSYLVAGDLLIARMPDPMGRSCRVPVLPTQSITAVDVAVLRIRRSDVNPDFTMWQINSPLARSIIVGLASGTTRKRISRKNLGQVTLFLPPLSEQERIVEILEEQLSRLDSALASVKAVREKSTAFRRSLLHAAFNGELTGGTEGWREVALGDIAKWSSGGTPKSKDSRFYGGDVKWCVIGDLTEGLVYETAQKITTEGLNASSAKVVPEGTVMIAMYGASIGRVGITATPMATNQAIGCAIVDDSKVIRWYLLHYLASQKRAFNEAGQGAAQPNISQTVLKAWTAPLPPIAAQERIVSVLEEQFSKLDKALEVANQLEARIASERRSLLHAAFTGELTSQWKKTHV